MVELQTCSRSVMDNTLPCEGRDFEFESRREY